jgi:prolyl-tRNA synthetase
VKFKDADLLGIPLRLTIGDKSLADGNVELKLRSEKQFELVTRDACVTRVRELIEKLLHSGVRA